MLDDIGRLDRSDEAFLIEDRGHCTKDLPLLVAEALGLQPSFGSPSPLQLRCPA
jgi:hypothetical protein